MDDEGSFKEESVRRQEAFKNSQSMQSDVQFLMSCMTRLLHLTVVQAEGHSILAHMKKKNLMMMMVII